MALGLFDFLKKKKVEENKYERVQGLSWYPPVFSQFGSNIYASDVVQQAINCIVQEAMKLEPKHISRGGGVSTDSVQAVLDNPNPLMTTSDFIAKIVWQLFFNYNSFVMPVWNGDKLEALFPLNPTHVDFIQDKSGSLFVKLTFANDYQGTIKYSDIIHIRYKYSVSEFMGGNELGQPDHKALLESLELNNILLQGVGKALKSSFAINGIVKFNTMMDNGKMEAELKKMQDRLNKNESGLMPMDIRGEFTQFKRDIKLVDEATLKFIDEKILRHFGVPLNVLTGNYTKEQYEAFFQKTIEPLIVAMNQAFTKGIFSRRKSFGYGHRIEFHHSKLAFMSMNEKIQWMTLASNVGAITINEMRAMMGFAPYDDDELGNTPVMSKNFGNADSVKDMDKNDIDKDDDNGNNSDNDAGNNNIDDGVEVNNEKE